MEFQWVLDEIINQHPQDAVDDKVQDAKHEYVDEDDVNNDFDGDLDEAYVETGRGQAEAQTIKELLSPYDGLESDDYIKIYDAVKEHYGLSTD